MGRGDTPSGLASGMVTNARAQAVAAPAPVAEAAPVAKSWVSSWKLSGVAAELSCHMIRQYPSPVLMQFSLGKTRVRRV